LWNGAAETVDFGSANWQKLGIFAYQTFYGTYMNTNIVDKLFQDIPHHVGKFPENLHRDVEKSVDRKNNTTKI